MMSKMMKKKLIQQSANLLQKETLNIEQDKNTLARFALLFDLASLHCPTEFL